MVEGMVLSERHEGPLKEGAGQGRRKSVNLGLKPQLRHNTSLWQKLLVREEHRAPVLEVEAHPSPLCLA